jgi:hypothetical protein
MKFMLLCYDDEKAWANAGKAAHMTAMQEALQITHDLKGKGQYILASPLQSPSTARSIRLRDGKRIVTDGPFAETREVLGGFYLINVDNIEQALAVASRHPGLKFGTVEVRPVLEIPGLPTG